MSNERRALVQKSWDPDTRREYPSGTISWADHEIAWQAYYAKWRCNQSAERINERGGFGHMELIEWLGALPASFIPSPAGVMPYKQFPLPRCRNCKEPVTECLCRTAGRAPFPDDR